MIPNGVVLVSLVTTKPLSVNTCTFDTGERERERERKSLFSTNQNLQGAWKGFRVWGLVCRV